jgi:hypothetical protein
MALTLKIAERNRLRPDAPGQEARGFLDAIQGKDPENSEPTYEEGWLKGYAKRETAKRMNITLEALDAMAWRWKCACGETENGNADEHCIACGTRITCQQAGGHSWKDGDTVCNRGTCPVV